MDAAALETIRVQGMKKLFPAIPKISVGMGTCGAGNGAHEVYESFQNVIKAKKAKIQLSPTGCFGFCAEETLVNCYLPGMPLLILQKNLLYLRGFTAYCLILFFLFFSPQI